MYKILIVDDEEHIRTLIKKYAIRTTMRVLVGSRQSLRAVIGVFRCPWRLPVRRALCSTRGMSALTMTDGYPSLIGAV